MKPCRVCGLEKPYTEFYRQQDTRDGYRNACKPCFIAESMRYHKAHPEVCQRASRNYRKRHPEKVNAYDKAYKRDHRPQSNARQKFRYHNNPTYRPRYRKAAALYKARKRGALITEVIHPFSIYDRDHGRCHICHWPVSRKKFHLDHLIPISLGGNHTAVNVAIAHPRCNLRRGAGRTPAQLRLLG